MRRAQWLLLGASAGSLLLAPRVGREPPAVLAPRVAAASPERAPLPLRFERNDGQLDERVRYVARSPGVTLALADDGPALLLRRPGALLRMRVVGARRGAPLVADGPLATVTSYFLGSDPSAWRTHVPSFSRVAYAGILDGIDLAFRGDGGRLEYDFVVSPGGRPETIAFDVEGADALEITDSGDLRVHAAGEVLVQSRPRVFQSTPDGEVPVQGRYRIAGDRRVAFEVGPYDHTRGLTIDPVLADSTYFGGAGSDRGNGIAVDASGNVYISGYTGSVNLPTKDPFQGANAGGAAGGNDAFVAKLDATGTALVYATYLGGSSDDRGARMAVDAAGNAYVVGQTSSTNFPTTTGALQTTYGGIRDGFVSKLGPSGSTLVYSTYLGGTSDDMAWGVAVDASGNAFVTGDAGGSSFPTKNAAQATYGGGGYDLFVAKLAPTGQSLVYSTFLGGSDQDEAADIALDAAGDAYVVGMTVSTNFPTHNPVQAACAGCSTGGGYDLLLAEVAAPGSSFVFSTYLGGKKQDSPGGIALDPQGGIYATGYTFSTDFPTTAGAWQTTSAGTTAGNSDAVVTKLTPSGASIAYSTYLGGGDAFASGIAVDGQGDAYVVGSVFSNVLPTVNPLQATLAGNHDAFLSVFNPSGTGLVFSTYLGGADVDSAYALALDGAGSALLTGYTDSTNFPTKGPWQAANAGPDDAFVVRIGGLPGGTDGGLLEAGPLDAAAEAAPGDAEAMETAVPDAPAQEAGGDGGLDASVADASRDGPGGGGVDATAEASDEDAAPLDGASRGSLDAGDAGGTSGSGSASAGCGCRVTSGDEPGGLAAIGVLAVVLGALRGRRGRRASQVTMMAGPGPEPRAPRPQPYAVPPRA